jgi:hypothetical protein
MARRQSRRVAGRRRRGGLTEIVGRREINAAVGQLDRSTQENAAMVEEATAAAQRLESETRPRRSGRAVPRRRRRSGWPASSGLTIAPVFRSDLKCID